MARRFDPSQRSDLHEGKRHRGSRLLLVLPFAVAATLLTSCASLKPDESIASDSDASLDSNRRPDTNPSPDTASPLASDSPSEVTDATSEGVDLDHRTDASETTNAESSVPDADNERAGDAPDADDDPEADADASSDKPVTPPTDDGGGTDANDETDAAPTDSCVSDCLRLGDFRCATPADPIVSRQLQVCSMAQGCLQWLNTATCQEDEICCSGACRAITYASSCESDYFVDAQHGSDTANAGTQALPFRTIGFAIAQAEKSTAIGKRIHVGAGLYNQALGETFPLMLRHGTSLFGSGPDQVTVEGARQTERSTDGSYDGMLYMTIVAGDETVPTVVSGMTVRNNAGSVPGAAVLCDRGSAPDTSSIAGVTIVDNVVVAERFEHGIVAAASGIPVESGCNLRVTRSRVTGTVWGIYAKGRPPIARSYLPRVPVAAQIGDNGAGNAFTWSSGESSGGIFFGPAVSASSIRYNSVTESAFGVMIDQTFDRSFVENAITISHNAFTRLSRAGLYIANDLPTIEELNDNTFSQISASLAGRTDIAYGLAVHGNGTNFPMIKKARRNRFIGNDVGILFGTSQNALFGSGPVDFGNEVDPGGNVFHCNSVPDGLGLGGDILITLTASGSIPFEGNTWDHFPPARGTGGAGSNGTDIVVSGAPGPTPLSDYGGAETFDCPAGRVKGPEPTAGGGARPRRPAAH